MMIIRKSAIGNSSESFIEESYRENVNIISSTDNSKGKTIVVQSLLYALGNDPFFPNDFKYQNYYHYVEFDWNGDRYIVCRKKDYFVVNINGDSMPLLNLEGLKSLFAKQVFKLPSIFKNGMVQIVDPVLFFQIFTIRQDSPNIATIEGGYTKCDFENMIYNTLGVPIFSDLEIQKSNFENELTKQYQQKKDYEKILAKKINPTFDFIKATSSELDEFDEKYKQLNDYCNELENIETTKEETYIELKSLSKLKKELTLLNKNTQYGEFRCGDCNSKRIIFTFSDIDNYSFDVSTPEMRKRFLMSIEEAINNCEERYESINESLKTTKSKILRLIQHRNLSIDFILMYKKELLETQGLEEKIRDANSQIEKFEKDIKDLTELINSGKQKCEEINNNLNSSFHDYLSSFGLPDNIDFFPSKSKSPGGSDRMFVKIIRLLTLRRLLTHCYPIIVDSFRDGELSSNNEQHIVDFMLNIPNQVILTATIKSEELDKYKNKTNINHIDYSGHIKRRLLMNQYYMDKFKKLLADIGIELDKSDAIM